MNAIIPLRISRCPCLQDRIASAGALIFDVDGTLAETETIDRCAFNAAFRDAGIAWYWDRRTYKKLLRVTGGKERIRALWADAISAQVSFRCRDCRAAPGQDPAL
jgi:phosphoglycolate phosphatase-like HAD superfamily hydrolase